MAGKRTSVYLTDELAAAVKASGLPLAVLLWRGLGTAECDHPKARVIKGLCGSCGTNVG